MTSGHIDGREINVLTINADDAAAIFSTDGGFKICLHAGHMKATVRGNFRYPVPARRGPFFAGVPCTTFTLPAKKDCVS